MVITGIERVTFRTPIHVPWSIQPIVDFSPDTKAGEAIDTKPITFGGDPVPFVVIRADGQDVYVPLSNVAALVQKKP